MHRLKEDMNLALQCVIGLTNGDMKLLKDAVEGKYVKYPKKEKHVQYEILKAMFRENFVLKMIVNHYLERESNL